MVDSESHQRPNETQASLLVLVRSRCALCQLTGSHQCRTTDRLAVGWRDVLMAVEKERMDETVGNMGRRIEAFNCKCMPMPCWHYVMISTDSTSHNPSHFSKMDDMFAFWWSSKNTRRWPFSAKKQRTVPAPKNFTFRSLKEVETLETCWGLIHQESPLLRVRKKRYLSYCDTIYTIYDYIWTLFTCIFLTFLKLESMSCDTDLFHIVPSSLWFQHVLNKIDNYSSTIVL